MATALAAVGVIAVAAPAAEATPRDPHVDLVGRLTCPAWGGPRDVPQWMWIEGNTGDRGWAGLGAAVRDRPYSFHLSNVPFGRPERLTVSYGCAASGRHVQTVNVSQPTWGRGTTVNIY